jgi:hypothetical protein
MRIKYLLITGLFLSLNSYLASSQQIKFQKTYDRDLVRDQGNSVIQTFDGGYIIAGLGEVYGKGDNVYIIKTNAWGDTLWSKTLGALSSDGGYSIYQTTDSGYIVTGSYWDHAVAGAPDMYLIKLNKAGDTLWTRTFGNSNSDWGSSVQQTNDGGYIIAGITVNPANFFKDILLVKTNSSGDTVWTRIFEGIYNDDVKSVQQTADGGYILAGSNHPVDVTLLKTDSSGVLVWAKSYSGYSNDAAYCVRQTHDSGYVIVGITNQTSSFNTDCYLVRTNKSGDTLWTRSYGIATHNELGVAVRQTIDEGFIIAGRTENTSSTTGGDVYLAKIDSGGAIQWSKSYGGANDDYGTSVSQTNDGGYIVTGLTRSFGAGDADVYLIKTDSLGNSGCHETSLNSIASTVNTQVLTTTYSEHSGINITSTITTDFGSKATTTSLCSSVGIVELYDSDQINFFSNPFSNKLTVLGTKRNGKLSIIDITGKEIIQLLCEEVETNIIIDHVSSGLYILIYSQDNYSVRKRIIKL